MADKKKQEEETYEIPETVAEHCAVFKKPEYVSLEKLSSVLLEHFTPEEFYSYNELATWEHLDVIFGKSTKSFYVLTFIQRYKDILFSVAYAGGFRLRPRLEIAAEVASVVQPG